MVTADELTQIQRRMAEAGITNAGAYMRKMALNGYILHVDLAPVKELVSLQRRCANNLNQVAVHANTFGVYPEEIAGLQRDYEKLWGRVSGSFENTGWCRPGYTGLYNIYMMEELHTILSLGGGGMNKINLPAEKLARYHNPKIPQDYISRIDTILQQKDEIFSLLRQIREQNP